jgi:hypothetical protein
VGCVVEGEGVGLLRKQGKAQGTFRRSQAPHAGPAPLTPRETPPTRKETQ